MANIKSAAQLEARSKALLTSTAKLGANIHQHLLDCMAHAFQHRNILPLHNFILGLANIDGNGKSRSIVRASAVKKWAEDFAFYRTEKDGKPRMAVKLLDAMTDDEKAAHVKAATANPFYSYTEDKAWKPYDLAAMIVSLVNVAKAKAEEKLEEGRKHNVPAELLSALENILPTAEKLKLPKANKV